MPAPLSRRKFLGSAASAGAGACLGLSTSSGPVRAATAAPAAATVKPAGEWPVSDASDENALLDVLRSGKWGRGVGTRVKEFEAALALRMQAKHCIATSSGTTALLSSLGALGIGPGDEVILPPYTFIATFNVITAYYALPIFADVDAATFQIDPAKMDAAITPATRLLLPVHIGGSACNLDAIAAVSRERKIPFVEDACQAPAAEWRGQPVGTRGISGCLSFQASKNLTSGEGGAVLTNDETFADQVYNFHTPSSPRKSASTGRAANFRLTEFQAALLLSQLSRFNAQQDMRNANATYLTSLLREIPGLAPAQLTPGNNRSAWHLFMMRYDARRFAGLTRTKFLEALAQAGVHASSGYTRLTHSPQVTAIATHPHYLRIYGKDTMARWLERNQCPVNDQLTEEAIWFPQTRLLGTRSDMERIAETMAKVQKRAGELARA